MEKPQQNFPLRTQIFSIVLIPTLVVSVCLAAFFVFTRNTDLDTLYQNRGETLLFKYAPLAQLILVKKDDPETQEKLHKIANAILNEHDVRAVSIYNDNSEILVHAGPMMHPLSNNDPKRYQLPLILTDTPQRFATPINTNIMEMIDAYGATSKQASSIVAWLEIELSPEPHTLLKYESLIGAVAFILLCLSLTSYFALKVSAFLTSPLEKITHAIAKIKEGQLSTRVKTKTNGELELLASGINSMAESLQSAREEMQHSIDQATEDLRSTLETIEIQNIELDMARKEAVEASRVKSEFLANMSHEIRTPLNGIIGFTNLLLKSKMDLRQSDYLITIQKSSEGLLAIINDILDFSKIEAGKLSIDLAPVNIRETLEEVLSMLAPMAHEKKLEQALLIYSDVPKVILSDALRIKQIITNLVNNAIKFSEEGAIIIRVMLEDEKKGKSIIKFSVSDAGIGLSEDAKKNLFQAFHQTDSSSIRKFQGTGLGLAISRHLVEMMGGEIDVDSFLGDGSTFWFTIRADIDETHIEELNLSPLSHLNVAVYDSNPTVCLATLHLLNEWAIETTQFTSVNDLLNHIDNDDGEPFDIAVIGLDFEDMENHSLLEQISNCRKTNNTKFLLIANPDHQSEQNPLEAYCDGFLPKPLTSSRLRSSLASLSEVILEVPAISEKNNINKPKVLAVDDNPANLKLVIALLEEMGINVDGCDSGEKAVAMCREQEYGIIFMDIQMPNMDGIEATRIIRQDELKSQQRASIIALTAHAIATEKVQLMRSGMDDYLTKPITTAQIRHAIQKWTGYDFGQEIIVNSTPAHSANTETATKRTIDLEQGIQLAGGKKDLAEEMLEMLIAHIINDRDIIKEALSNKDYEALLERVHYTHGATRYCGVPLLRQAANDLENDLKKKVVGNYPSGVNQLLKQMDAVITTYNTIQNQSSIN